MYISSGISVSIYITCVKVKLLTSVFVVIWTFLDMLGFVSGLHIPVSLSNNENIYVIKKINIIIIGSTPTFPKLAIWCGLRWYTRTPQPQFFSTCRRVCWNMNSLLCDCSFDQGIAPTKKTRGKCIPTLMIKSRPYANHEQCI